MAAQDVNVGRIGQGLTGMAGLDKQGWRHPTLIPAAVALGKARFRFASGLEITFSAPSASLP
jgi:hypothetical protein